MGHKEQDLGQANLLMALITKINNDDTSRFKQLLKDMLITPIELTIPDSDDKLMISFGDGTYDIDGLGVMRLYYIQVMYLEHDTHGYNVIQPEYFPLSEPFTALEAFFTRFHSTRPTAAGTTAWSFERIAALEI